MEERRPRFFKVLVGDFGRRLEIPKAFLGHIPEVGLRTSDTSVASSAKVLLTNSEGNIWLVDLKKVDGRVFLNIGWPKFVKDNSLREYEFLVFRYDNNMHFMVSVFGRNACEKAIRSLENNAQATGSLEGKLKCDVSPCSKRGHSGAANSHMQSHSQISTLEKSTQGDEHTPTQTFVDLHEVGLSRDELKTNLILKPRTEDDKAKAIAEVMRRLHIDRVTIDLLCAMLSLQKWNVDAAVEDFDVCKGKPQIQNQFLKQKLVSQFDFIKRQLRRFFPPDDDCSSTIYDSSKSILDEADLSNQPLHFDLTRVKGRLVDEFELCYFSPKRKRRIGNSQSVQTSETPPGSPRLAHLNSSDGCTKNVLEEKPKGLESAPANSIDQMDVREAKACLLYEKPEYIFEVGDEQMIGSLSQDFKKHKPKHGELGLSEESKHNQRENEEKVEQGNIRETYEKQLTRNVVETCQPFMTRGCIESSPFNSEVSTSLRVNELYITWKLSDHASPLERMLLEIQRENFTRTLSHIQRIIRNHPSDLLCAAVIEATMQKDVLKWDLCLEDGDAQTILTALMEHARKIKEMHDFNVEMRKEEFSAKIQDQLKWQLKELECMYTSLELDYKKAMSNASIAFSILQEHKKKMYAFQDETKDLQQSLMVEDEMRKLEHQDAEHESLVHTSIMERVRLKTVLKSYQQTLDEVKKHLASTEIGLIDVEALVKVEMDNMHKEIVLSKGSILNISFK